MDINTLPSYLRDLLSEVSLMDEEAFPPNQDTQPGETILGTIEDIYTRKLWATCLMHQRENELARVECRHSAHPDGQNCAHARPADIHGTKSEICGKIFWAVVHHQFDTWGSGGGYGVRRGWKFVELSDDDGGLYIGGIDDLPDVIRAALRRRFARGN